MKCLLTGMLFFLLSSFTSNALVACSDDDPEEEKTEVSNPPSGEDDTEKNNNDKNNNESMELNITITVNGTPFAATLENNEAGRAFAAMLPLTLSMSEMNGNEKYHYLDESLPTDSHRPGTIQTGDLMLYGSSCVVLFYKTFSSSYSYTRLGRINNPEGLKAAIGRGNANISFTITEN